MNSIDYLNKNIEVKIDRPIGSSHPDYPDHIYLVNYGYVPNTVSGDGEELDCYVLGEYKPLKEYRGKCIAIIHRINDNDDKLIIVPENRNFSNKEIDVLIEFQERFFKHEIIRENIEFNSLIPELSVSNIETSKKFYKNLGFKRGDFPISEEISATELSIPMYYGMTDEEIQYVIDKVNDFR